MNKKEWGKKKKTHVWHKAGHTRIKPTKIKQGKIKQRKHGRKATEGHCGVAQVLKPGPGEHVLLYLFSAVPLHRKYSRTKSSFLPSVTGQRFVQRGLHACSVCESSLVSQVVRLSWRIPIPLFFYRAKVSVTVVMIWHRVLLLSNWHLCL